MIGLRLELGYVGASPQLYNPATQFSPALLGAWYDPSDYATLFQDSAGATPVTAVTQPVGRMLDKSGRSNTLLQATAAARPVQSARVNLLTKTDQIDDASWTKSDVTVSANSFGLLDKVIPTALSAIHYIQTPAIVSSAAYVFRFKAKAAEYSWLRLDIGTNILSVNAATGAFTSGTGTPTVSSVIDANGVRTFTVSGSGSFVGATVIISLNQSDSLTSQTYSGDGIGGILLGDVDFRTSATAALNIPAYQRVNTASDYDTVGFPQYQVFDGVDDSMATGAVTLSADMDCFIAIRRSAGNAILAYAAAGNLFGAAESASAVAADAGSGTPTYFANGTALNGGAVGTTRGQVFTALTESTWIVLEVRNLNLSAAGWATFGLGNAGAGFFINGDIGGIILAPAGDATTRTKNRQYLGNKVGLTL